MPDRTSRVRPWVELAEEDFKIATHEMEAGRDAPFGGICFHAQQCVEKYIKALLVLHAVDFPKIHDLEVLLGMVRAVAAPEMGVDDVLPLNRYAVEARYPGDWGIPTHEEAKEAVARMNKARDALRKCLPEGVLNVA